MICPSCEGKNRDEARFCMFCGSALVLRCPTCDTELAPGARFCDSCGTPIGDAAPAPIAAPGAAASRKVVTILFADLVGSTALEERMDAESVRTILERFYASMRSEVERFGGRIVKFTGDGVMAAFGVPDVREDDALRAVDSALAMRENLEQLAADLGLDLGLRIGVNTGEVVVSDQDEDVVGDAVNVASRLEGAAGTNEIFVGEETWRLTRSTSRYDVVPPLTLKGKSEPVPAYRLHAVDERTTDSAAAPFVGRAAELGRLLDAFQSAVDSNSSKLVTIIGSPGLGKTRLARELATELAGQARIRETRCEPAGAATFAPIADALRGAAALSEAATEDEIVAALAARLPENDPDRDRIALRAAAILGVGLAGTTEETFWAVRRLIEAAAATSPVVIMFEDVHWAEPLMLDLIEHLDEMITSAPVLLVATARPELRDLRPSFAEGGRCADVISLEGLDASAAAKLALNLLGADELPAALLSRIPESTEGNPLFVRELVRMLVDDRVLQRTSDGWTVTVDVDAIQVPPTIQSLLAARVDRLRSDERAIIEIASVIGKEFYRGALDALAPPAIRDHVDGVLESLRRKELVEPAGSYWIDEPIFRFHHALIRDAAYRRLLKESRAELHERAARWIDDKAEGLVGEHDEIVGYHLEQATDYLQQLGKPWEELSRRAAARLAEAARRALDRDDLAAAASLSARSLARSEEVETERVDLFNVRCGALLSRGDVGAGAIAIAELEPHAITPRTKAWLVCFKAELARLAGAPLDQATDDVAAAAATFVELDDQSGAAKAHNVHASLLAALGRYGECEAALDRGLNAARGADDLRLMRAVLAAAPHAALWGPSPVSRAGGRCLDVVRLLRITSGSLAVEAISLRCQALLEAFRGRGDAARRMLRSAQRSMTELGLDHELLETEQFMGIVEFIDGDAAAAVGHLTHAYDGFVRAGVSALADRTAAFLGSAHLMLDEVEDADRITAREDESAADRVIVWCATRAAVLAKRGMGAEARRLAERAVALAEKTDALVDHGLACRSLAQVLAAEGDHEGARREEARAVSFFERKGATALAESRQSSATAAPVALATGPSNAARRAADTFMEAFARRDWSAFDSLVTADCMFDDRRAGLRDKRIGPAGLVAVLRPAAEMGTASFESTTLAMRGERLVLMRCTARGRAATPGAFETQFLSVQEIDDEGLISAIIDFDPDDLEAASALLEERYTATGDPANRATAAEVAINAAIVRRDWHEVKALLHPNAFYDDRRPGFSDRVEGRDAVVEALRVIADIGATDFDSKALEVRGEDLALLHVVGSGNDFTIELYVIAETTTDGRLLSETIFDNLDVARLDLDSRSSRAAESAIPDTRALRAEAQLQAAWDARDWDAFAALLSEDSVLEDKRLGMNNVVAGRAARMENMRAIDALIPMTITTEVVAVRGETLALQHFVFTGEDGTQGLTLYQLDEFDADGLLAYTATFDESDLRLATRMLDERYFAGEGAPIGHLANNDIELVINEGRWDEFRSLVSPDVVIVDHRPASLGSMTGVDAYIEAVSQLQRVMSEYVIYAPVVYEISERVSLAQYKVVGTSVEGSPVELVFLSVGTVDADGVLERIEWFSLDAFDDALARYRVLSGADVINMPMGRTAAAFNRGIVERDWETVAAMVSPDIVYEERRTGFSGITVRGRDEFVESLKLLPQIGVEQIDVQPLAWRVGGAVGIATFRNLDDSAFGLEMLMYNEFDAEDRFSACITLDLDAMQTAVELLDHRFIETAGAPYREMLEMISRFFGALNGQDWESFRNAFTDAFELVDHRPASLGRLDAAGFTASTEHLVAMGADFAAWVVEYLELEDVRALMRFTGQAINADGGAIETTFLALMERSGSKVGHIEFFPLEEVETARLVFRERAAVHETIAERGLRSTKEYFAAGDFAALEAMTAEDIYISDRRPTMMTDIRGREAGMVSLRTVYDVGARHIDYEVLATRGELLLLASTTWRDSERTLEVTVLMLNEHSADGLQIGQYIFEPDDIDAAFAKLDELAGEATSADRRRRLDSAGIRMLDRMLNDLYAGDLDAFTACMTPDSQTDDRRAGFRSVAEGRDARVESAKHTLALGVPRPVQEPIAIRGDHLVLWRCTYGNDDLFKVETLEIDHLTPDLKVKATVVFDAIELDAAHAELNARWLADLPSERKEMLDVVLPSVAAFNARNWDLYRTFFAEDVVVTDHRPAGWGRAVGVDERIARARGMVELSPDIQMRLIEPIAWTRNVALSRFVFGGTTTEGAAVEIEYLITGVVANGQITAMDFFDPDDLADARSCYEGLVGGRPENAATRFFTEVMLPSLSGDTANVFARISPHIVVDDRRPGVTWRYEGEQAFDGAREMFNLLGSSNDADTVSDVLPEIEMIAVRGERFCALSGIAVLGDFELALLAIIGVDESQMLTHLTLFNPEDRDAALAEIDRLAAADTTTQSYVAIENRATRVGLREHASRYAPVAIRGDHLALGFLKTVGASRFDVEVLQLSECNDNDEMIHVATFDGTDLDSAFAALDERWLAGDVPEPERVCLAFTRCLNAHDWDGLRSLLTDDFVQLDHRPAGYGTIEGRESYLALAQTGRGLTPDKVDRTVAFFGPPGHSVALIRGYGTTDHGSTLEWEVLGAGALSDGKLCRLELFDPANLDAALARALEYSGAGSSDRELQNAATRTIKRSGELIQARDRDAYERLASPEIVFEDIRPGLQTESHGLAELMEQVDALISVGVFDINFETLAIRGDSLALSQITFAGTFEVQLLSLNEVDDHGRITYAAFLDDLDAAYDELDRRYLEQMGNPEVGVLTARMVSAANRQDWSAFREVLSPDLVVTDRRVGIASTIGLDDFEASLRAIHEITVGHRMRAEVVYRSSERTLLVRNVSSGTTTDGGDIEFVLNAIMQSRDGKLIRLDMFDGDDLDAALAFYESKVGLTLSNAATAYIDLCAQTLHTLDWERLRAATRPDCVNDDRRLGLSVVGQGTDYIVDGTRAIADFGGRVGALAVLATRGDNLALSRVLFDSEDSSFEVETYVLSETDDEGRCLRLVWFDASDVDPAFDELDRRMFELAGRPEVGALAIRMATSFNQGDWGSFRETLSDAFVATDHREIFGGAIGPDEFEESLRAIVELTADHRMRARSVYALSEHAIFMLYVATGTTSEGGDVEFVQNVVLQSRNGELTAVDMFDVDDVDGARARYDAATSAPGLTNAATDFAELCVRTLNSQDWDAFLAAHHPDCVLDDRRLGLSSVFEGVEHGITAAKAIVDVGARIQSLVVLATRGDSFALTKLMFHAPGTGFETEAYLVIETDDDGLASYLIWFDFDAIDAAFDELDTRYLAREGSPEVGVLMFQMMSAINRSEWSALRAIVGDDFVWNDRRSIIGGDLDADEYVEMLRVMVELVPDSPLRGRQVYRLSEHCAVVSDIGQASTPDGAEVNFSLLAVIHSSDGKLVRIDVFDADDLDGAVACFDAATTPTFRNRAYDSGIAYVQLFNDRDWVAMRAATRDDAVSEDRRAGLGNVSAGIDAVMALHEGIADLGVRITLARAIATRGDHMGIGRVIFTAENGFEVEAYLSFEIDEDGLATRLVWFGDDGLDAAFDELDERYLASGVLTSLDRIGVEWVRAYNARDWNALRSMSEKLVYTDHEPVGFGTVVGTDYVSHAQSMLDVVPDMQLRAAGLYRERPASTFGLIVGVATGPEGSKVTFEQLLVSRVDDVGGIELHSFGPDQFAEAQALFDSFAEI